MSWDPVRELWQAGSCVCQGEDLASKQHRRSPEHHLPVLRGREAPAAMLAPGLGWVPWQPR